MKSMVLTNLQLASFKLVTTSHDENLRNSLQFRAVHLTVGVLADLIYVVNIYDWVVNAVVHLNCFTNYLAACPMP
jgi:hypothetical protein